MKESQNIMKMIEAVCLGWVIQGLVAKKMQVCQKPHLPLFKYCSFVYY